MITAVRSEVEGGEGFRGGIGLAKRLGMVRAFSAVLCKARTFDVNKCCLSVSHSPHPHPTSSPHPHPNPNTNPMFNSNPHPHIC